MTRTCNVIILIVTHGSEARLLRQFLNMQTQRMQYQTMCMNMIERYVKSLGEKANSTPDHNTKGHLNYPLDHNAKNAIYMI